MPTRAEDGIGGASEAKTEATSVPHCRRPSPLTPLFHRQTDTVSLVQGRKAGEGSKADGALSVDGSSRPPIRAVEELKTAHLQSAVSTRD